MRTPQGRATIRLVPRRAGIRAGDSYGGRPPTSHERRAGAPWDASYLDGPAPWDTGRPQPAIRRLAVEGAFAGAVLDAGCGTGENALHIASLGLRVVGVDVAGTALSIAREKAADRGVDADFVVADALHLERLDRMFETVLDCGLFHTFDGDERRAYVAGLASVTGRGGRCTCSVSATPEPTPVLTPSRRRSCGRRSREAAVGASRPSAGPDRDELRRAGCAGLAGGDRAERLSTTTT